MTTYAKRKLKYSRNENFNLLHYVKWDRFVTLAGSKSGLSVTLSYLQATKLIKSENRIYAQYLLPRVIGNRSLCLLRHEEQILGNF
jgi:hypothetical protein